MEMPEGWGFLLFENRDQKDRKDRLHLVAQNSLFVLLKSNVNDSPTELAYKAYKIAEAMEQERREHK